MNGDERGGSSRDRDMSLSTLLGELADVMNGGTPGEYTRPAWSRARQVKRRREVLVAAVVVALVGVGVVLLVPRGDKPIGPAEPAYSSTPVRGRAAHTATLLRDGRVLIVGGCVTDGCTTAADSPATEFYVPGRGFTAGHELRQPRQGHTATLLTDGRVLIVGGWAREGAPALASAEVYQPGTGRFESVGSLKVARGGHIATLLPDGRVLIAGGDTATTELFDPTRNEFRQAEPMPGPRFSASDVALTDGRVLVAGGRDESGKALASAVIYNPASGTWQPTGSMGSPRDKFALARLSDGRVLALGGTPDDRERLRTTEIYNPGTGQFLPGPPMDTGRYKLAVALDTQGRVIVASGTQLAVFGSGAFHPIAGTAGSMRWSLTATSLPSGDVLVVGGYDERINIYHDALLISANQIVLATQ